MAHRVMDTLCTNPLHYPVTSVKARPLNMAALGTKSYVHKPLQNILEQNHNGNGGI